MDDIIVATPEGIEERVLLCESYDFEIGDNENSFQVVCLRSEWESMVDGSRIYIPGTEYGGIYKIIDIDSKTNTISPGGYTWRGLLQKKVIVPPSGADYATDSGDLNAIITSRVEAAFPGLFTGSEVMTGVEVSGYKYERYTTLYNGLKKLLKDNNYRMELQYDITKRAVVVSAVPIVDYSRTVDFSSDYQAYYSVHSDHTSVNHLICLGAGQLRDRLVRHLYMTNTNTIRMTPYYTGKEEVAEVYDYAGADEVELVQSGKNRLIELQNHDRFDITIDDDSVVMEIGDIAGGTDYKTGLYLQAPVVGKIVRMADGFVSTEYQISDDVVLGRDVNNIILNM